MQNRKSHQTHLAELIHYYGFSNDLIANQTPTLGCQKVITTTAAKGLELKQGSPIHLEARV